jgi:hypothetical protein
MTWSRSDEFRKILRANPTLIEQFVEEITTKGLEVVLKQVQAGGRRDEVHADGRGGAGA